MIEKNKGKKGGIDRRDFLKATATIPILGAFGVAVVSKENHDKKARSSILSEFQDSGKKRADPKRKKLNIPAETKNSTINLGFIGLGIRGKYLMYSAGFSHPDFKLPAWQMNTENVTPQNVRCTAVCDLFDPNLEYGLKAAGGTAKAYRHYEELLASPDVDAVVIATSDHFHAPITKAAAAAGKHVYCEKCMTHDLAEAFEVREAVKKNRIVFQLGHQNRNASIYERAMDVVDMGIMGHVSLIQCFTNRNVLDGAWIYNIPKEHGPKSASSGPRNVDWDLFVSNTTRRDYDPNRFFRWRCFWDYGTGIAGDLLTHEMDVINMIMQLGIPATAVSSGGIYCYKEYTTLMTAEGEPLPADDPVPEGARPRPDVPVLRREVPDVWQVVFEWPEKNLTVVYNSTLANSWRREQIYFGDEVTMDLSRGMDVYADSNSKRYRKKINRGEFKIDEPMISFRDVAGKGIEAITSATSQWTAGKGLLYTYKGGRQVNTTSLHINNWIEHIRANDTNTMCNVDDGFVEAVTAHMATLSYKKGCRVRWDAKNEKVVSDAEPLNDLTKKAVS